MKQTQKEINLYTTLHPFLFDLEIYLCQAIFSYQKNEEEFVGYWNSMTSILPDSIFLDKRMDHQGYRNGDVRAERSVMIFFKHNNYDTSGSLTLVYT